MTRAEFVEREGVTFSSFRRWLQKLRNEVSPTDMFAEVQISGRSAGEAGQSHDRRDSRNGHEFVKHPSVEVRFPRGTVVRFYDSPPADTLLAMVETTEGRAC